MRWESSIVPGVGSFRLKLILLSVTGSETAVLSWLTGWQFSFVWYVTAIFTGLAILCSWAVVELRKDYGRKRN